MDDGLVQAMLKDDQSQAARITALEARVRELEEHERIIAELQGQRDLDVTRIANLERQIGDHSGRQSI